eukprot:GFKZ01015309.1.p1 GENE.GFKZ01015309.1~~GFKZ01015309.1.p1  ORF type:complete len:243 (-),score=53.15 GFKZ01015309.1:854-1582(-)
MVGPKESGAATAESSKQDSAYSGPSECASRDRASDAADAVKEMARMLNDMNPDVVRRLVQARDAAASVHKAFPGGDRRFDPVEWDSDDDVAGDDGEEETDIDDGDPGGAEGESCQGLLDPCVDPNAVESLERVKREYDFDVVGEMNVARLDFFERIRLVNFLRTIVKEGAQPMEAVARVRQVLETRDGSVLADDRLLEPVIEGDVLLTVLETEEDFEDAEFDTTERVIDAVKDSLRETKILP